MSVKQFPIEADDVRVTSNDHEVYYSVYPKSKSITFSQLKNILKELKDYNFVGVSVDRRGLFLLFSKPKLYSENSSITSSTSLQSSKA